MQSQRNEPVAPPAGSTPPEPWEPMRLTHVGTTGEILESGGGKLSTNAPDGPDVRKPPGH